MNGEENACFLCEIYSCGHLHGLKSFVLFPLDWFASQLRRFGVVGFLESSDDTESILVAAADTAAAKLLNLLPPGICRRPCLVSGSKTNGGWLGGGHKAARVLIFPIFICHRKQEMGLQNLHLLSKTRDRAPKGPSLAISVVWVAALDVGIGILFFSSRDTFGARRCIWIWALEFFKFAFFFGCRDTFGAGYIWIWALEIHLYCFFSLSEMHSVDHLYVENIWEDNDFIPDTFLLFSHESGIPA